MVERKNEKVVEKMEDIMKSLEEIRESREAAVKGIDESIQKLKKLDELEIEIFKGMLDVLKTMVKTFERMGG